MILLFVFSLSVSLATLALYVCLQWPGMILHGFKPYLDRVCPAVIKKPLYDCLICMSSVWTITFWLLNYGWPQWQLLWAILIVAGINTLICVTLEKITDYGC